MGLETPAIGEPVQMVIASLNHAATSAKSAIPGTIPGGAGTQADPRFSNLNVRSYHSPTGGTWIVGASTNLSPSPNVVVIGSGLSILGNALAARDGITASTAGDLLNLNGLQSIPKINASGQWAIASGSSAGAGKIMKSDGSTLSTLFSAGTTLPGSTSVCGGTFTSANIGDDGSVSFCAVADVPGLAASGPFGAYTNAGTGSAWVVVGSTVPGEQPGNATLAWSSLNNLVGLSQSADGAHWLAFGKVVGVNTVAVDNNVKIQSGAAIINSFFVSPVSSILDAYMETNGDWYAIGNNADGTAWAVRNGVVVAYAGAPIVAGSSEHWKTGSNFILMRGNPLGNYVLTGTTDNADTTRNVVLVLNGQRVLARLSDPVDLNADGTFAGSLFLFTPQDKGTFCADGHYYFSSRLKGSASATSGLTTSASFLRVLACPADYNGSGGLEVQDIFDFLNGWFAGSLAADFNRNGSLAVQDIFDFLNAWFTGC